MLRQLREARAAFLSSCLLICSAQARFLHDLVVILLEILEMPALFEKQGLVWAEPHVLHGLHGLVGLAGLVDNN